MKSGEQTNLEVNRDLRRAFVMHWIDLGRVSIHSVRDSVHIRGSLMKLPGSDTPLTSATVEVIFRKLKLAAGGRRIMIEFDNWVLNSSTGTWEQISARDKRNMEAGLEHREQMTQASYHIAE
jgi:hypothetical protein